jgi:hypothetical protein
VNTSRVESPAIDRVASGPGAKLATPAEMESYPLSSG